MTVESNTGEVVVQVPKAEYDALRAQNEGLRKDALQVARAYRLCKDEIQRQAKEIAARDRLLGNLWAIVEPSGEPETFPPPDLEGELHAVRVLLQRYRARLDAAPAEAGQ